MVQQQQEQASPAQLHSGIDKAAGEQQESEQLGSSATQDSSLDQGDSALQDVGASSDGESDSDGEGSEESLPLMQQGWKPDYTFKVCKDQHVLMQSDFVAATVSLNAAAEPQRKRQQLSRCSGVIGEGCVTTSVWGGPAPGLHGGSWAAAESNICCGCTYTAARNSNTWAPAALRHIVSGTTQTRLEDAPTHACACMHVVCRCC